MIARRHLDPILSTVLLITTLLITTLPALATEVNVKYADADYANWTTWRFAKNAEQQAALDAAGQTEMRAIVRAAITERLKASGFTPAASGEKADFKVAIDGTMREVFDVRDYHRQISDHVAFVMEGGSSSYREGTLMIRILDGDDVVWTGWITEEVKDPDQPEKQIRKAVRKILRKFPPRERR